MESAPVENVDGSLCSFSMCDEYFNYWATYAGEIPDFTKTTMEQVDEWIEVCNFSHLAYASQTVVNAVKNATEEQIRDENWLKNYWALGGKEIAVGNMDFWYNAWKFLHRPGMIWKKFADKRKRPTDAEGYIFCDNETLTIAWRGTNSFDDWLTNLNIQFVEWPHNKDVKGTIHAGFLQGFDANRHEVRQECQKLIGERNITQMHITGHSQGAALAALSCLDFTLNPLEGQPPIRGIAVSSPICGDKEFAEYFSTVFPNLDSISHNIDPVVTPIIDGFLACGNRQYIKVPADWNPDGINPADEIIKSHSLDEYRRFILDTKQYIQENQIEQQASTHKCNRFCFR